jgi:hypothetical protein
MLLKHYITQVAAFIVDTHQLLVYADVNLLSDNRYHKEKKKLQLVRRLV